MSNLSKRGLLAACVTVMFLVAGCDKGTDTSSMSGTTGTPSSSSSASTPATTGAASTQGTNGAATQTSSTKASGTPATVDAAPPATGAVERPKIAYITNGVDPFWVIAQKGAQDAAQKFNVDLTVIFPNGANDQKQKLEDLLVRGVDGIAISPIDAGNQTPLLNQVAAKTKLITQDSDAPDSDRLMYIGVDNYKAGRMCGELVKGAVPAGGEVAIFVGRLEQDNARLRRQGLIDELLDRTNDPTRLDPPDKEIKGDKYSIVATLTDQFDRAKAKNNAEDTISAHPNIKCMVGLFAYNPPMCLEALKRLNKAGQIALIGFDEQDNTLQAIKDGQCFGTVVQNPYMYGHESVRVTAALARGNNSVVPANKVLSIPARKITKDNVDQFWADLRSKTSKQ